MKRGDLLVEAAGRGPEGTVLVPGYGHLIPSAEKRGACPGPLQAEVPDCHVFKGFRLADDVTGQQVREPVDCEVICKQA